jgi:hypothetical protein
MLTGLLTACSGAGAEEGPKVIETENLTPTQTPVPTPTPTVDIDALMQKRIDEAVAKIVQSLVTPTPMPTPTPTVMPELEPVSTPTIGPTPTPTPKPTRTPTPTPEPIVRPVAPPAGGNTTEQLINSFSTSINNHVLTLSGNLEGQSNAPTTIQVWQARDAEAYSTTCSTERPVAFIRPGNGASIYTGQTSPYQWTFCTGGYSTTPITDQVPWLYSQTWSYNLRNRKYIFDPYIYDFSVSASLAHEKVERLQYGDGVAEGWRIIVFSGDKVIANQWIDRF